MGWKSEKSVKDVAIFFLGLLSGISCLGYTGSIFILNHALIRMLNNKDKEMVVRLITPPVVGQEDKK